MITLHITSDDLVKLRFAYRPLLEIPFSYRVLINPEYQSPHLRWVEEAQRTLHSVNLPYLAALVTPDSLYIPHFLTPTPTNNHGSIEDDLEQLSATPDEVIRRYTLALIEQDGDSEIRRFFVVHPHEAMACLVEELHLYWQRTLAHYWPRMISVLEGDILYRGRLLALEGPGSLVADLHPAMTYQNQQIQIRSNHRSHTCDVEFQLEGEGIQLVPLVFSGERRMQIVPEWQPRLSFPVRGTGLYSRETRASKPLEQALGAARARVLQILTTPATTGEVAFKARITAGTASVHLSRLTKAGLVEPHRSGVRVYYRLTRRGEELIALFERIY
jgi:DNA-binding transcriptional ArsR family regulator